MSKNDGGLRALFRRRLPHFHWTSVETPMTESGVPDLNFCAEGIDGWIECKRARHWEVSLRPAQIGWLMRRARAGGCAFVAVRRALPSDELWLLRGAFAADLKKDGLPREPARQHQLVGLWSGGPARWDWNQIARALVDG